MDRDELEAARDALLDDDDDDDLEFYMTFPSPPPVDTSAITGEIETFSRLRLVGPEEPEPVVFLLGWAGCEDKELAKYSKLYEDLGCVTVRYTLPEMAKKITPLAARLLDLLAEMSLQSSQVFIHAFGDNGGILYQHMSELMFDKGREEYISIAPKLTGVIFDCCPGSPRRHRSLATGASSNNFFYRLVVSPLLLLLTLVMHYLAMLLGVNVESRDCTKFLKSSDRALAPCLFLSSIPETIEAVAEARQLKGSDVSKVCFDSPDGSSQAQLLRDHKEAYISAVTSFAAKCLKNETNRDTSTD